MASSLTIRVNPALADQLRSSPEMARLLQDLGDKVAEEATSTMGGNYKATAAVRDGRVEVTATHPAEGVGSQAGWDEFGADGFRGIPARAPLRNGAEANGLQVRSKR